MTTFTYAVPDINDPSQKRWVVTCNDPDKANNETILTLDINANPPGLALSAMSPIMQYTRGQKGSFFVYTWIVFGAFASAIFDCGPQLIVGQSPHPMRVAIQELLDRVPAAGMQAFETPPMKTST